MGVMIDVIAFFTFLVGDVKYPLPCRNIGVVGRSITPYRKFNFSCRKFYEEEELCLNQSILALRNLCTVPKGTYTFYVDMFLVILEKILVLFLLTNKTINL